MDYPADVRLVYAHAERDGGHHHHDVVAHEGFLHAGPFLRRQARVVGSCLDAGGGQGGGKIFCPAP